MAYWQGVLATSEPTPDASPAGVEVVPVGDVMSLVDRVDLQATATVVVAAPQDATAARTAATVLVGRHPEHPVTVLVSPCAPVGAVAATATALAATDDAGRGAALLEQLLQQTWTVILLTDVTRLGRPNPTLRQHARSLFPGSQFLVRTHPDAVVLPVQRPEAALVGLRPGTAEMVVTGSDDPALAALVAQARPTAVRTVDLPGRWAHLYGRAPTWQAALLPWGADVPTAPTGPACDVCGHAAPGGTCRFCSAVVTLQEAGT
ncbi:hypothetical protein [Aquipuribacter hungaricus]|uniref:Uncharacterized protein n=1 Tax=Aquipuribacter hungaricus TaxID=545624 RepID=A0ABV7WIT0_9MICO